MIRNNDLRIGNWINVLGKTCQVIDVMCDSASTKEHEAVPYGKDVEGIIITAEILNSSGFPITNGVRWNEEWGIFLVWGEESPHYYSFKYNQFAPSVKIRYVHQLQNLFFSLTGEELIINL